jgi:hypothetical protein
VIT